MIFSIRTPRSLVVDSLAIRDLPPELINLHLISNGKKKKIDAQKQKITFFKCTHASFKTICLSRNKKYFLYFFFAISLLDTFNMLNLLKCIKYAI